MKFPKLFSKQKPTQEIQAFGIEFLSEQHDLFRRAAPRGTLLDIMFPSDRQLVEIEKVCKPFYRRDSDV